MSKIKFYRFGQLYSFVDDTKWCIQEKKWWGWTLLYSSFDKEKVKERVEKIEKKGGIFL